MSQSSAPHLVFSFLPFFILLQFFPFANRYYVQTKSSVTPLQRPEPAKLNIINYFLHFSQLSILETNRSSADPQGSSYSKDMESVTLCFSMIEG